MSALTGAHRRPERKLLITAVDAKSGEPEVFDRTSATPLSAAVAASTAFPGIYPPITVNGRRYMDGALRSGTSADLAAGAGVLIVVEPLAHLFPREPLAREVAEAGADSVVTIGPDEEAIRAFGHDLHDLAAWQPAYSSGIRQGVAIAERVRPAWHGPTRPVEEAIGSAS